MTTAAINLKQGIPESFSTKDKIRIIMLYFYPRSFARLDAIIHAVRSLEIHNPLLLTLTRELTREIEEMHRKEKFTLFPFLLALEEGNKKADCCQPFNDTKAHYTHIHTTLVKLTGAIQDTMNLHGHPKELQLLLQQIGNFQADIAYLHEQKEAHLFNKFKDCNSNCKPLAND